MFQSRTRCWALRAPLLFVLTACGESTSSSDGANPPPEIGTGDGSLVFDSSRVATLELLVSEEDLATLRTDADQPMGFDDFTYVPARLTYDGTVFNDVGLRVKGNSSRVSAAGDAVPFKLDTNRFVRGQKLDGQTKLNLHKNFNQASKMNEFLSYGAFREYGIAASRTAWAVVTLNGESLGVYTLVEQVGPKPPTRFLTVPSTFTSLTCGKSWAINRGTHGYSRRCVESATCWRLERVEHAPAKSAACPLDLSRRLRSIRCGRTRVSSSARATHVFGVGAAA